MQPCIVSDLILMAQLGRLSASCNKHLLSSLYCSVIAFVIMGDMAADVAWEAFSNAVAASLVSPCLSELLSQLAYRQMPKVLQP